MLIKKIGLVAVVLSLGVSSAFADNTPRDMGYVGVDVQWDHLKTDSELSNLKLNGAAFSPKENLGAGSIFGGYRWDFLGAELGVTGFLNGNKSYSGTFVGNGVTTTGTIKQRNLNAYLDGIYYHCLARNFDLKALIGVGLLSTELKGTGAQISTNGRLSTGSGNNTSTRLGLRLGIGGEYYFSRCWSSSLMYKFQTGNSYVKNVQAVALGVAYHF